MHSFYNNNMILFIIYVCRESMMVGLESDQSLRDGTLGSSSSDIERTLAAMAGGVRVNVVFERRQPQGIDLPSLWNLPRSNLDLCIYTCIYINN